MNHLSGTMESHVTHAERGEARRSAAAPLVRRHDDGPVRTVTLARAERHNALVPELLEDLLDALRSAASDDGVRVVVLAADGRSFSTGGDVAAFAARDGVARVAYARRLVDLLNETVLAMLTSRLPIVTAVQGLVTGGALGFVLASDVVVAATSARFAPYYVEVGFSPDGGWTALLPRVIGRLRAGAVQLTNAEVDARTALAWGLVTHVVEPGDARSVAVEIARDVAANPAGSVTRTKRLLHDDLDGVARRLAAERDHFVEQIATTEAQRGMEAFLERSAGTR